MPAHVGEVGRVAVLDGPPAMQWDEVVSITALGTMPTFDATVEGTHNFVADYTRVHNPATVISVRYGLVRQIVNHLPHSLGFDPTSLGLPRVVTTSGIPLFPRFQPEGYNAVGTASNSQRFRGEDTHSLIYSLTRIAGAHTVKAGGESRVGKLAGCAIGVAHGEGANRRAGGALCQRRKRARIDAA